MRDKVLGYLYDCGFVDNYVKKLMFASDINNLYEDYVQETWLALCEVKEEKWVELYNRRPNHDEYYDIRNWVSVLIRNTVCSTTSTAYRRLKKQSTVAKNLNTDEWKYLQNTVPEDLSVFNAIKNNG